MTAPEPYIAYTQRFFRTWLPVYDLFAALIVPAYRAAVRAVDPRPGLSVLDACSGTGEMAVRLARRGAEVTGIDVTEEMLAKARAKAAGLPATFHVMDARRLTFPDRSFDVVVLSLALHDMPRAVRQQVLREARRVARERIVVLDYDFPRRPAWLRRLLVAFVQLFETAYLTPFVRDGGVESQLEAAGLSAWRTRRLRPLTFAVHVVRP
jgi:ubiquinone/menaquinone biosynthesis C-methylase UbiE